MDDEELIYEPDYDGRFPLLEPGIEANEESEEDDEGPPWGWDQPEFSPILGSRHSRGPPHLHHHHHHRGPSPWSSIFPGGSRDPSMLSKILFHSGTVLY
jgi:hypothetical protein